MFKQLKKLISPIKNTRGNILLSAFITMVVLSMSVAGISQLTINQYKATSLKIQSFNNDLIGEALLEQAVFEFEDYLINNTYDFDAYMATMTTSGITAYGVLVENVTGTIDENGDYTNFGDPNNLEARAYRFTYTNPNGSRMVMYSYISSTGTFTENLNPFDFAMATNGSLIINGGYLRNPDMYGDVIQFGNASPYINRNTGDWALTPGATGLYPDFNGSGGNTANVYYSTSFSYCQPYCYDIPIGASNPYTVQESEYLDIIGSGLETGGVNEDKVISDFFGNFSLANEIMDFVRNDGPTGAQTITDPITMGTIGTVVLNNSDIPTETCTNVKIKGKWTLVCSTSASTEPYTDVTGETWFDPANTTTVLEYGAVYDGNLIINENFEMTNLETANPDALIVTGDLTFDNTTDISMVGFIVVLGDLYFTGENVSIGGGFYVLGQTYIDFNIGAGFDDPGTLSTYSFTLLAMDNIFFLSHYESRIKADNAPNQNIDMLIFTQESIYIDAVNNRLYVNGVFFAAARGTSGNDIPAIDELGNPITGIVVNAFNGYINSSGVPTIASNFTTFDFDILNENNLADTFFELPVFETLLISEGVYTFERSEIFYNQ